MRVAVGVGAQIACQLSADSCSALRSGRLRRATAIVLWLLVANPTEVSGRGRRAGEDRGRGRCASGGGVKSRRHVHGLGL